MAVRNSEMVSQRVNLGKTLMASLDTYSAEIAAGYGDFLTPAVEEGETPLDVRYQLTLFGRIVGQQVQNVEQLDDNVVGEVNSDDKVRFQLGKAVDVVDDKLRSTRHTCRGLFGFDSLSRVGLQGDFPRGPLALYKRGRLVQTSLRNPDLGLEPVFEAADEEEPTLTPAQLAARLEPELTNLGRFVDERYAEYSESADARSRRQQTMEEFDRTIGGIVRMTQGMLRLAGRPDLAARFRATLRRFRRQNETPVEEQTDTGEGTVTEPTTP